MARSCRADSESAYVAKIADGFVILQVVLLSGSLAWSGSAVGQMPSCTADSDARPWAVVGDAASDSDLSGAACAPDGRCLLVSDEKRRAWFFRSDETATKPKLTVSEQIKLSPVNGGDEADLEGAAFDGGHFYALGSHGASRRKGEFQASRYSAYRIEADGTVQSSGTLAGVVAKVPGIREHFCTGAQAGRCESLQNGGANIEGLAVREGNLYVGFRAPAPGGKSFILRVAEKAIFGQAGPDLRTFRVELGQDASGRDLGVRDLAVVADGFLILAGPSLPEGDEAVGSGRVFHWREGDQRPRLLRELTVKDKGVKPEVLLLLGETSTAYRTLVMCDGVAGGAPGEYQISKNKP
jgi:hypothetical protein